MSGQRIIRPVLNPDKDFSAAHAFDGERVLPRAALEALGHEIPHGEHPDDDRFIDESEES